MKYIYIKPELEIELLAAGDVITVSDNDVEWPGEWGDGR